MLGCAPWKFPWKNRGDLPAVFTYISIAVRIEPDSAECIKARMYSRVVFYFIKVGQMGLILISDILNISETDKQIATEQTWRQ